MTREPLDLYEALMGDGIGEVPVPHSFEEVTTAAFLEQDRADKASRRRSQQLADEQRTARQDQADMAAFLGRGRSHADILSDFATMSDRADAWQAHLEERAAKRAALEREQAQERRIAELEAEVASSHARAEQLSKNFGDAVQGWTAERRRHEQGAGFQDDRNSIRGDQSWPRSGPIIGIR